MKAFLWSPSEYFFFDHGSKMYCLAAEPEEDTTLIVLGTSMMRQHNFIFEVKNGRVGIAKAKCSEHPWALVSRIPSDKSASKESIIVFGILVMLGILCIGLCIYTLKELLSKMKDKKSRENETNQGNELPGIGVQGQF